MSFPLAKENRRRKAEGVGTVSRRNAVAFRRRTGWVAVGGPARGKWKGDLFELTTLWRFAITVLSLVWWDLPWYWHLEGRGKRKVISMGLNSKLPASLAYISRLCLKRQNCASEQNHFDRMVVKPNLQ